MEPRRLTVVRETARLPWTLAIAALAISGWMAWEKFGPQDIGDPIATSLAAFERQNRLTVFSAQLAPVVSASDERIGGLLQSRQVAVIPARVDYTLDLSKVGRDRLNWDAAGKGLDVRLPPVTVGKPNLDEANAQYLREGVFITREAQAKLNRDNTLLAERQAQTAATNPQLLDLARSAARDAVLREHLPDRRVDRREVVSAARPRPGRRARCRAAEPGHPAGSGRLWPGDGDRAVRRGAGFRPVRHSLLRRADRTHIGRERRTVGVRHC